LKQAGYYRSSLCDFGRLHFMVGLHPMAENRPAAKLCQYAGMTAQTRQNGGVLNCSSERGLQPASVHICKATLKRPKGRAPQIKIFRQKSFLRRLANTMIGRPGH
jgi:hypothetical protein